MSALSQRLRAAADAPRLADHVRASNMDGTVKWRKGPEAIFCIRQGAHGWGAFEIAEGSLMYAGAALTHGCYKRESAIRAGLLALAERLEAQP